MSTQTFLNGRVTLHAGNCLDRIKDIPDASIDAVCTDPPYALVSITKRFGKQGAAPCVVPEGKSGAYVRASAGFMGKAWDVGDVAFAVEFWSEVYRVLKPGGHVLAFGGTRTVHRLTCAIEDAGFEIRDMVAWLYGSGFPKSHDVSKGIDKARKDNADWQAVGAWLKASRLSAGFTAKALCAAIGAHGEKNNGGAVSNWELGLSCPTWEQWQSLKIVLNFDDDMEAEVWRLNGRKGTPGEAWQSAEIIGSDIKARSTAGNSALPTCGGDTLYKSWKIKAANSDAARQWEGWGTALKPALEPITVARKPLEGTVAANVLAHGTGALNIAGCRVGTDDSLNGGAYAETSQKQDRSGSLAGGLLKGGIGSFNQPLGRWPANLIHDGSDEVVAAFPTMAGGGDTRGAGQGRRPGGFGNVGHANGDGEPCSALYSDTGSAARFFYNAKADSDDRIGSKHPTVKPVDLMRYLVRLVTPPGGTVLDPFAGTGTTGEAAFYEGFNAVLIEREEEYRADIARRMALVMSGPDERKRTIIKTKAKPDNFAGTLFAEAAE